MKENYEIFGVKVIGEKEYGEHEFFSIEDIYFIDIWSPKKNYHVPRIHTKDGTYTVPLTLEAFKKGFSCFSHFVQLDNGNLVNIKQIDQVIETAYATTVHFKNCKESANVSRNKKHIITHLLDRDRRPK